jgi:cytolysin (calcineurin-like family phosphatase)
MTLPLKAMMNVVASTKVLMTAFLMQAAKDNISEIIASDQLNNNTTKTHT